MPFTSPFKRKKTEELPLPSTQKEREEREKRRQSRHEARHDPASRRNIAMPYIWIVVSILLGLCLYTSGCGFAGDAIRFAFLGLFSYGAYLFPVLFFLLAIFWRRGVVSRNLGYHVLLSTVSLVLLLALVYILTLPIEALSGTLPKEEVALNGGSYFSFEDPRPVGGGFLGALLGWVLYRLVGPVMTIILAALAVLLYGIFGFGFSPDAIVRSLLEKLKKSRRDAAERRERKHAEEAERVTAERAARAERRGEAVPCETEQGEEATDGESAAAATTEEDKHRRFATLFRETDGATAKKEAPPAPAASEPSEADLRAYKENRIRERLRQNDGIHTYAVSDLRPSTPPYPEAEAPRPTGGSMTHMMAEVLSHGATSGEEAAEPPFRGVEDFRRVTVNEPVRVHAPAYVRATAPESAPAPAPTFTPTPAPAHTPAPAVSPEPAPAAPIPMPPKLETAVAEGPAVMRENGVVVERESHRESAPAPSAPKASTYVYPPTALLRLPALEQEADLQEEIHKNQDTLVKTLESFGIPITITGYSRGPRITRYEFIQKAGIRVAKVAALTDDITQKLSTQGVRIEAPIPNKSSIGVEVPNRKSTPVRIRSLLDTETFRNAESKTTVAVGCDVTGNPVFFDIAKAPHMLIAGATGMGKSVCINSVLISLLYKASPEDVRMILFDPKKVEFNVYAKIPHLLVPVVTDPTKAAGALNWAVNEMERRYDMIEAAGVRDIKGYNAYCLEHGIPTLPKIVIVIDELNDLMMSARKMVEASICRIAQKARAAGIHLLIGTQRPSVNVITGDIKVNIPARIAFRVNQLVDSRTILDMTGAERLLPHGDMLFSPAGTPQRVQGAFVEDDEVKAVVAHLAGSVGEAVFDETILSDIEKEAAKCAKQNGTDEDEDGDVGASLDGVLDDPKFEAALEVAFSTGSISTSLLQRKIAVGFGKASRFIDAMCEMGVVGESQGGARPRELLMSRAEYEERRHRLFDD
ncbi:MAG: DNA translocase FtsK [Clostridia bacterium]|nr:DNA translocase FtsK [Clostridia bacterium]